MKFIMKLYLQMSLNFGLMPIKNEKFAIKFQSYEGKDPKEI